MLQVHVRETHVEPKVAEESNPTITGGWWLSHTDHIIVSKLTHWGWLSLLAVWVLAVNGACCLILH